MYKLIALTSVALLSLSACVPTGEDIDSSSDQYEPEGFDPERGADIPENGPSEPQR